MEEKEESTWDKWCGIVANNPSLALSLVGEATVETFAELGEAVVTVVAIPALALAKEAKRVVNGTNATARYGLRQFKEKTGKVSEEIDKFSKSYKKNLDPSSNEWYEDLEN